jgi:2-oxoglutarate dehydrogenase E1 component
MHIADLKERQFLQERMEGADKIIEFSVEGKRAILNKVIEAEEWEKFLGKKYVGTKRFGLDGGESMIPALEASSNTAASWRARNHVRHGAPRAAQHARERHGEAVQDHLPRICGRQRQPRRHRRVGRCQISPRHQHRPRVRRRTVHMSLVPNPSHLEAVNPVVLGKVRAQQVVAMT